MKKPNEDPDGSYRNQKKDYERYNKGGRKRHFGLAQKALIWDIYKRVVVDGLPVVKVAEILEMSECQCRVLLRKVKYALATSDTFDVEAADLILLVKELGRVDGDRLESLVFGHTVADQHRCGMADVVLRPVGVILLDGDHAAQAMPDDDGRAREPGVLRHRDDLLGPHRMRVRVSAS